MALRLRRCTCGRTPRRAHAARLRASAGGSTGGFERVYQVRCGLVLKGGGLWGLGANLLAQLGDDASHGRSWLRVHVRSWLQVHGCNGARPVSVRPAAAQRTTLQRSELRCNSGWHVAAQCNTGRHGATRDGTVQHGTARCSAARRASLRRVAGFKSAILGRDEDPEGPGAGYHSRQHCACACTGPHCALSTPSVTARAPGMTARVGRPEGSAPGSMGDSVAARSTAVQRVALCCRVVHCGATCCAALQRGLRRQRGSGVRP